MVTQYHLPVMCSWFTVGTFLGKQICQGMAGYNDDTTLPRQTKIEVLSQYQNLAY